MPIPDIIEIWVLETSTDGRVWRVIYIGDKFFCEKERMQQMFAGNFGLRIRQVPYNSKL